MKRVQRLIGLARDVYLELGPGHSEYIYQRGMEVELRLNQLMYQTEVPLPIFYKGSVLGHGRLDIMVDYEDECIPIELKALITTPRVADINQLKNYIINEKGMHKKPIHHGLLINFPQVGRNNVPKNDIDVIIVDQQEKLIVDNKIKII